TATFEQIFHTLSVTSGPNGSVAKNPDLSQYAEGSTVQLTATPDPGFMFAGWSGDATGNTNPLTVTMDADKSITGTFGYHLDVSVTGSGAVAKSPDQNDFAPGTIVQLTATPVTGWHFVSWGGAASGTASPTTVTMDAAKSVS